MTASPGSSPKPNPKPADDQPPTADTAGDSGDAAHQPKHKAGEAKEAAGNALGGAKEKAAEAKAKASEAASEAKQKAAEAVEAARTKAAEARDSAKAKREQSDEGPTTPSMTKEPASVPAPDPAKAPGSARVADSASRSGAGSPSKAPAKSTPTKAPAASGHAPSSDPEEPSLGQLVSDATAAMSTLLHSEIELAKLELRSTVKIAGTSVALFLAAAIVLVFSLTFGFIALAEGINALGLSRWLSFLIVFGFLLLLVGLSVLIGIKMIKRVRGPEKTIKTTKETVDYLKSQRG